jgi:hypothetical protein
VSAFSGEAPCSAAADAGIRGASLPLVASASAACADPAAFTAWTTAGPAPSFLGDLGQVHLRHGDLDGALAAWSEFIDCAQGVQSVKITDTLTDLRVRLSRYDKAPGVTEPDGRAATLL